ncbi:MAG TPA: four helix bundle protein [Bacteroidales bacterium]|nr:four helix bundle protein [Bacteroidales bacterium]
MKDNIIKDKSFAFALKVIALYSQLQENKEFVISKQLLRCSTSIGANINEAIAAESRADFAHKMSIACKEARESLYWLELLHASNLKDFDYTFYVKECTEIVKILTNIVKSTKSN